MYLICHVTSQDHLIEGLFEFMVVSCLWCVTTLTKFGNHRHCGSEDIMFLICQMTVFLKGYVNLFVEATHCESPPSNFWWSFV